MGNPQEPAYREFKGLCRTCGKEFTYHNSIRRHPSNQECVQCEAKKIVETLQSESAVKG